MGVFILDTDILSLIQHRSAVVLDRVDAAQHAGHTIRLCVVTVEEQFTGWLKRLNSAKTPAAYAQASFVFSKSVELWGQFTISPETEASRSTFQHLKRLKLNVGPNDLRIASVVLDLGAILVTRNAVDYRRIPGVKFEDWGAPPPSP